MAHSDKKSPRKTIGRPVGTGGVARELEGDEIQRVLRCQFGEGQERRNRALLLLGLGTGMRVGEMVGLRVGDIRDGRGRIVAAIRLEKHSTKSKRSREVYVSRQARGELRRYLDARGEVSDSAYLFASASGGPISANWGVKVLRQMFDLAGLRGVSSHSMRRTHANALRRRGVDLKVIQHQLGHASLATTERYFQVDPLEAKRAVEGLRF